MPYLLILILVLSILFNLILSRLYRRHYLSKIERSNGSIDLLNSVVRRQVDYILSLESELRRLDGYNQELQRRCSRQQVKRFLPGPNFSDYLVRQVGNESQVQLYRLWWN